MDEVPWILRPPSLKLKGRPRAPGLAEQAAGATPAPPSPAGQVTYYLLSEGVVSAPLRRETAAAMLERGGRRRVDLGAGPGDTVWRPLGALFPGVRARVDPFAASAPVSGALAALVGPGEWLWDSLGYPFRGGGLGLMAAAALVMGAFVPLRTLTSGSVGGVFILVLVPLFWFFTVLQQVVWDTGSGRDEPPRMRELGHWGRQGADVMLNWLLVTLACFWPAGVTTFFALAGGSGFWGGLALILWAAGLLYWPMALLLVAVTDSTSGMLPAAVLGAIRLTRPSYLPLLLLTFGVFAALIADGAAHAGDPRWLTQARVAFDQSYLAMVLARAAGLFYRRHRADLGFSG